MKGRSWLMRMLAMVAVMAAAVALALEHGAAAQGGFGFGNEADLEIVERFDGDGDGRLDAAERQEARAWLGQNRGDRGGGFGRRRGFGGGATPSPGRSLTPADVPTYDRDVPLYDTGALRTLFISFEEEDWASELAAFYGTDVEVPATIAVDGRSYPGVGVHFRGASSYRMVADSAKKSLNLSFNFVDDDQRLLQYRTLNLLNGNGDPSFLRTVLYAHISSQYLPTPKTNFVRAVINGESWGVYINAQQFNSDFTRDWFDSRDGTRWKAPGSPRGRAGMEYLGESAAPYRQLYEIKTDDEPRAWVDMIRMFRVLNETPIEELEAALEPMLDIDGVLRFLAVDVALVNTDGYWTRASDYSLYQDEDRRFHVLPHDFNEAMSEGGGFGGFGGGGGGGPTLDPLVAINDPGKPLRSRLLRVPALRERYLGYVRDIAETWLDWSRLEPIVTQYHALIAEEMALDTRKLYGTREFDTGPASIRSFVDRRRAFLLDATR
jgi:spore coat protein CotH